MASGCQAGTSASNQAGEGAAHQTIPAERERVRRYGRYGRGLRDGLGGGGGLAVCMDRLDLPEGYAWLRSCLASRLRHESEVLEIGCGCGQTMVELISIGCRCTGVDKSSVACAEAKRRIGGLPDVPGRGAVLRMDAESLLFPDEAFDAVVFWRALHHIRNCAQSVSEAARVCRRGGWVLIAEPSPKVLDAIRFWERSRGASIVHPARGDVSTAARVLRAERFELEVCEGRTEVRAVARKPGNPPGPTHLGSKPRAAPGDAGYVAAGPCQRRDAQDPTGRKETGRGDCIHPAHAVSCLRWHPRGRSTVRACGCSRRRLREARPGSSGTTPQSPPVIPPLVESDEGVPRGVPWRGRTKGEEIGLWIRAGIVTDF